MKVAVSTEAGEIFSFSTEPDLTGIFPHPDQKPAVLDVLDKAAKFLNTHPEAAPIEPAAPPTPG